MSTSPALTFEIVAKCAVSKARTSRLLMPHGPVDAPVFMPVGTQGTMKGVTSEQLENLDCKILLGNTYHLGLRPGEGLMKKVGGLHNFMNWNRNILTDSGGFQMVSLLKLANITEDGVMFQSPRDGTEMLLTPEKSIELQNAIGADIIMQLDDVVHTLTTGPRVEEAMFRSIRWLDRCIEAHSRKSNQNLFPIIQGGLDLKLREKCIEEMVKRDMPGYAIGGLSGGEDKDQFWRLVKFCTDRLPENKPIYCMGVGYATDLIVCVALGVDMFDCVYPTRTARFGNALVKSGNLSLKQKQYESDFSPIDSNCTCLTCQNYTRAYIHMLIARDETGCHLLTIHNIAFQLNLMRRARESIVRNEFPEFSRQFMLDMFGEDRSNYPKWMIEAFDSPDYRLAREMGYDLSKEQFFELFNYARMVQKEHINDSETLERSKKVYRSMTPTNSRIYLNKSRNFYPEDLWIQYLREYFDSESTGSSLPAYDAIKAREQVALNEIRKRRLVYLSKLPKLPDDLEIVLLNCFLSSDLTKIVQKFCIPISVKDLKTLRPPHWLNDEVINFYFELLLQRSKEYPKLPKIHIFNTFFYPKLKLNGYSAIKRWTRKVDIFSFDMILIPIHLGIHWCCAEINFKERSICYYDSLHNSNYACLKLLQEYLVEEHMDKKGTDGSTEFNFNNWILSSPKDIPCQQNGYDCGVFVCIFAEYRSRNAEFTFSQKDMNYFRDRISYEIVKGTLIY